jgi:TPR repeat protein
MREFVGYIKIICKNCFSTRVAGGGFFSYQENKIFSEDQVPKIEKYNSCYNCNSKKLDYKNEKDQNIIRHGLSRTCTNCSCYITDRFIEYLPNSNFCASCILSEFFNDDFISKNLLIKGKGRQFSVIAQYIRKLGIEQNYWHKKAADYGDPWSAYQYAWSLSYSNYDEYLEIAEKYFEMAIKKNNKKNTDDFIKTRYADLLLNNSYKNYNPNKAINLLKEASRDGSLTASEALGHIFFKGIHIEQNFTKSFKFFEKSLNEKLPLRYRILTLWIMTLRGIGTEKNELIASNYLMRAIENYAENWNVDVEKLFLQCTDVANGSNNYHFGDNLVQEFLTNSIYFPFKSELLQRCGGEIIRDFSHTEIIVSKLKLKNVNKIDKIWIVKSQGILVNSPKIIGQIERLDGKWWLAVDANGIAHDQLYLKFKDAVIAISKQQNLNLPIRIDSN